MQMVISQCSLYRSSQSAAVDYAIAWAYLIIHSWFLRNILTKKETLVFIQDVLGKVILWVQQSQYRGFDGKLGYCIWNVLDYILQQLVPVYIKERGHYSHKAVVPEPHEANNLWPIPLAFIEPVS